MKNLLVSLLMLCAASVGSACEVEGEYRCYIHESKMILDYANHEYVIIKIIHYEHCAHCESEIMHL